VQLVRRRSPGERSAPSLNDFVCERERLLRNFDSERVRCLRLITNSILVGCSTDERDELVSSYSMTSSARTSSFGGTSRPSVFAVLRLMTNSNLVGCKTGKSAGFAPLRIEPA
jgi:hypothetical protein